MRISDWSSDVCSSDLYDRYGHAGVDPNMGGGGGGGGFADAFGDIFGDIFGQAAGGRGRGGPQVYRGADLRYNLEITLQRGRPVQVGRESCRERVCQYVSI